MVPVVASSSVWLVGEGTGRGRGGSMLQSSLLLVMGHLIPLSLARSTNGDSKTCWPAAVAVGATAISPSRMKQIHVYYLGKGIAAHW